MQDSALHILLLAPGGVPRPLQDDRRPFFVEFGYSFHAYSNSEYLRRIGWRGVRFDLDYQQPSAGVFKEEVTAESVVDVFQRHQVPPDLDYVSIDIDSCDVWVFLALTAPSSPFRPRLVQIEYNRHFGFEEDVSLDCRAGGTPWGTGTEWPEWPVKEFPPVASNVYGASLRTVARAAALRGYELVWVERCYDLYLVRGDLVCPGAALRHGLKHFRNLTAVQGERRCGDGIEWFAEDVGPELRSRWLLPNPAFV